MIVGSTGPLVCWELGSAGDNEDEWARLLEA